MIRSLMLLALTGLLSACASVPESRATGDLGVIVERSSGSVLLVEHSGHSQLARIEGLGDLSHASVVFSRDQRFAYVFGRDGGLTKVDLLAQRIDRRVVQGGNSIGGAISQDGRWIAVGNYEPGGLRIFDSDTLDLVADIPAPLLDPAAGNDGKRARAVGVVDAPGQRFLFSLFDTGAIWSVDMNEPASPVVTRYDGIGRQPYDALLTPDGHYYLVGLFGEDGMALLDLWQPDEGVSRVLHEYGRGDRRLPVYKMPHLEGWAVAGNKAYVPAVGHHQVLVLDTDDWQQADAIDVAGQPVFVMARPDARQIWVNFAHPDNHLVQVIDTRTHEVIDTLEPGPGVLHMEFTPRGDQLWMSVRDANEIQVWDPYRRTRLATLPAQKPSGIFFTSRAHRIGL